MHQENDPCSILNAMQYYTMNHAAPHCFTIITDEFEPGTALEGGVLETVATAAPCLQEILIDIKQSYKYA